MNAGEQKRGHGAMNFLVFILKDVSNMLVISSFLWCIGDKVLHLQEAKNITFVFSIINGQWHSVNKNPEMFAIATEYLPVLFCILSW